MGCFGPFWGTYRRALGHILAQKRPKRGYYQALKEDLKEGCPEIPLKLGSEGLGCLISGPEDDTE